MRIGFISDTHGDLAGWRQAVEGPFSGADLIIHAGDLLYHGPRNPMTDGYGPAALAETVNASPVPVIIARGNCDSDVDQLALDYPIQAPYAFVQIEGLRIMAHHGDGLPREEMANLARRYGASIFAFGHIHLPVLEQREGVILLNPGSPSLPKAEPGHKPVPTVAVFEDGTLRIVHLPSGETVREAKV